MTDSRVPDRSAVASPPRVDVEYDDIDISSPIGSGGQAVVLKGHIDTENGPDTIALKEPQADPETLDDDALETFMTEIRTWETVDAREREKSRWTESEHIVGVIDSGDELPWIAIEYMDGGGLDDRLAANQEGMDIDEALWIGERVCRGVELAHNYGVAHLDLKPANVLFCRTDGNSWNQPKVSDWGLARVLNEESGSMEALSVKYAAPEQFEPEEFGDPDMLTDIYQIGVLLYAMLTGDPPFTGSRLSVMRDIVDGDPPDPPSAHREGISEALDAVILTALERDKNDRYGAIRNFGDALEAIRHDQPLPRLVTQRLEGAHAQSEGAIGQTATVWPMFQGGPTRTGFRSTVDAPTLEGAEKWSFRTGFWINSSPAVANGTVYVGSDDEFLYAIATVSGDEVWQAQTDGKVRSSPAVGNGLAVVGSDDGGLYAFDAESGDEVWQAQTDDKVRSSPVVAADTVVVGSDDGCLYAFEAKSGDEVWTIETGNMVRSSPAVADGTVYVGSGDKHLYAVDLAGGERVWTYDTGSWVSSSPAVAEDVVYVGSDDGNLYGVDADTGDPVQTYQLGEAVRSSPAVGDGTIFVESDDGILHAVDADTGLTEWTFELERSVDSSPAVANGTVFVESGDGALYAVDANSGTQNWSFETGGPLDSSPAVADGTVYVGSADKYLYALE